MSETSELRKIKKEYGESFMKLCRRLFPTILEKEGLLYEIISSSFSNNSRTLCEDIESNDLVEAFKEYVYSKIDIETKEKRVKEKRTPYELLKEAGYDLIECTSEEEIQQFRKYYEPNEELCTFNGGRLKRCIVFFAVKKDAEKIKRAQSPRREDEYGTSVMSIQFSRGGLCTVSIKNRYNHTVNNPDATYGNDLDKIIKGLTESFKNLLLQRGLKLNAGNVENFVIPGYVVGNDGRYYKYNQEINGIYYCPGNVAVVDGNVVKIENPEKQMLIDYFLLDLEKKTIICCDDNINDSFVDDLKDIEKIEVEKDKEKKTKRIIIHKKEQKEPIIIEIDKDNQIIGYENENLREVGDNFLTHNRKLKNLHVPNLSKMGNHCLSRNTEIEEIELPKLEEVGDYWLYFNEKLNRLCVPNLRIVGDSCLTHNKGLEEIELPKLEEVGSGLLFFNEKIKRICVPNLRIVGIQFLCYNKGLEEIELPRLEEAGCDLLFKNENLTRFYAPNLRLVGGQCLKNNKGLEEITLPKLEEAGDDFLSSNKKIKKFSAPNLRIVGNDCLMHNEGLEEMELPKLEETGYYFLPSNKILKRFFAPNLRKVGFDCLRNNEELIEYKIKSYIGRDIRRFLTKRWSETLGEFKEIDKLEKRLKEITFENKRKQKSMMKDDER